MLVVLVRLSVLLP